MSEQPGADRNYLNIHVLISHSPSCLNRDDMNMQKSAIFGGVRRVRISSQCLKRALRFSEYYKEHLGYPSVRTLHLDRLQAKFAAALKGHFPPETVARVLALIAERDGVEEGAEADAVAPWCVEEVAGICKALQELEGKEKDEKRIAKALKARAEELRGALVGAKDIALSGRMATSGLMTRVDGSLSVAHALTTHAVDEDVDWFTAMDDLVQDAGESGAGHLNTQEFGAGVFYRYASLNVRQLQDNLGKVGREEALRIAAHVVHLLATVVPSAKQHSFAAHNPADLVLTSFADMPLSAANAFETPVRKERNGGFIGPSIAAFETYMARVHVGYGLDDPQVVFSLWETKLSPRLDTMAALEEWVRSGGK
jgi:CRISPR system Cascade subunit CasC